MSPRIPDPLSAFRGGSGNENENFIHEIIFTRVISYYSQNLFAMLASYFARWPSLDSYLQPRDGILGNSEQTRDTFLAAVSVPVIIVSFFTAIAYAGTCLWRS